MKNLWNDDVVIIGSNGKINDSACSFLRAIRNTIKEIDMQTLRPSVMIMNKADYDDIVKWSRE